MRAARRRAVESRASLVLDQALACLEQVRREGIWDAIGRGAFGDVKRTRTGGKGYRGVVPRDAAYLNPFLVALERGDAAPRGPAA